MDDKSGGGSKMERQRHALWDVMSLFGFGYSHGRPLFDASLVCYFSLWNMMEAPSQRDDQLEQEYCQLTKLEVLFTLFSASWIQFELSDESSKKRMTKMLEKKPNKNLSL